MATPNTDASWSESELRRLTENDRNRYETLCEGLELRLAGGESITDLAIGIRSESSPLRELALLNLAKCWTEDHLQQIVDGSLHLQNVLPAITEFPQACREWQEWLMLEQSRRAEADEAPAAAPPQAGPRSILPASHEFVRELSHTPLSWVYLVRHREVQRLEVFKAVPMAGLHPAFLNCLENEAKRAGKIPHPGLVQIYSAGVKAGWRYLLMEYMNGGSLADRLRSGPLPWEIAIRQFAGVARALQALHEKGTIAHGDIKPANLMYTRLADDEEHLKIGDFGLSSDLRRDTDQIGVPRFVVGTPGYVAPELLEGGSAATVPFDTRVTADLFALGVTLYQALSGKLPYQQAGVIEPAQVDPHGPLVNSFTPIETVVHGLPEVLCYVVKRGCARDRSERFASAAEFARALEKCLPLTPATPATAPTPLFPQPQPAPWRLQLSGNNKKIASGAAAILVVLLAIWLYPSEPPADSTPTTRPKQTAKKPLGKGVTGVTSQNPETFDSPEIQKLVQAGWTSSAATAALELNNPWFAALKSETASAKLAARQLEILAALGENSAQMELFEQQPHLASALALCDHEHFRKMSQIVEDRNDLFVNLIVQYPQRRTVDRCVDVWESKNRSIRSLYRHGLFGAEQIFLSAGPNDANFVSWADDLMVNQIEKDSGQAANLLATFLEHHQSIARRMKTDQDFAGQFKEELWPKFVSLSADPKLGPVLFHEGVWDVLQVEGGDEILRTYKLVAVVIFSGKDALPADPSLRRIAAGLLKDRFEPVVKALANRELRTNDRFHALMKRQLPKRIFAVLCQRLVDNPTLRSDLLADFAKKTNESLESDVTGVDPNRWLFEGVLPQLIYVRLGIKIISGESLYGVEKSALLLQITKDVLAVGLPELNLKQTDVKTAQMMFDMNVEREQGRVKELLQAEQIRALTQHPQLANEEEIATYQAGKLRELLRGIVESLGSRQESRLLDVSKTRVLFEKVVCTLDGSKDWGKVDLRHAELLRLRDGRMFCVPTSSEYKDVLTPAVQQFFRERIAVMARAGGDEDADRAYREIVSAWWLLAACDRIRYTH
jgi:serine/threonine protein kinase